MLTSDWSRPWDMQAPNESQNGPNQAHFHRFQSHFLVNVGFWAEIPCPSKSYYSLVSFVSLKAAFSFLLLRRFSAYAAAVAKPSGRNRRARPYIVANLAFAGQLINYSAYYSAFSVLWRLVGLVARPLEPFKTGAADPTRFGCYRGAFTTHFCVKWYILGVFWRQTMPQAISLLLRFISVIGNHLDLE